MTTKTLKSYADEKITKLGLGSGGPLGTEFVVAYDAGPGQVRISDGHSEEICGSEAEIDAALQDWADWIAEEAS